MKQLGVLHGPSAFAHGLRAETKSSRPCACWTDIRPSMFTRRAFPIVELSYVRIFASSMKDPPVWDCRRSSAPRRRPDTYFGAESLTVTVGSWCADLCSATVTGEI